MSIIFTIYMSLFNVGDCIKFTMPTAEGIPMLVTSVASSHYDIFYVYPGIGDIHFRANAKRIEQNAIKIDKSKCSKYNKRLEE